MECRKFNHCEDYEQIRSWFSNRGMPPVGIEYLPSTGFIVDGICAGFIYRLDNTRMCMFDTFVANPEVDKEERDKALDLLGHALEDEADKQKYEVILCNSKLGAIISRAERFGYVIEEGYYSISKDLKINKL